MSDQDPERSPRRLAQQRGTKSKAEGKLFEKAIKTQLQIAEHLGIVAFWQHAEPTFRLVWKPNPGGRPQQMYLPCAAGFADFSGVLTGGLAFAIECKSTNDARFRRAQISDAQQRHLEATSSAGGLALLALQLREDDCGIRRTFVMRWAEVPWQTKRSAETIGSEDLADHLLGEDRLFDGFAIPCGLEGCAGFRIFGGPCLRCLGGKKR